MATAVSVNTTRTRRPSETSSEAGTLTRRGEEREG